MRKEKGEGNKRAKIEGIRPKRIGTEG